MTWKNRPARALEDVARLLGLPATDPQGLSGIGQTELLARTRQQLAEAAKALELHGTSKLKKEELARRLLRELREAPAAAGPAAVPKGGPEVRPPVETPAPAPTLPSGELEPAARAKLDLGPAAREEAVPAHIPWSYGQDRITAAAVDPERLFVYWEVTDPAIERAREALGPGGPGAWLSLRVYDTSGLIFDGTNAHGYFDHGVDRSTRQWFFQVGKPSSTAFVEIGMKSAEGFFARIARSGRVDFPRREPAPWSEPEWMTVRETGEVAGVVRGGPSRAPPHEGHAAAPQRLEQPTAWTLRQGADGQVHRWQIEAGEGWERVEWREGSGEGWFAFDGRIEWEGPRILSSWEAGPFSYPVEVEPLRREAWEGRAYAYRLNGVTHVVYGPWQVVIRNLAAHGERTVLGRWEVYRSWIAQGGRELRAAPDGVPRAGASERRLGASERLWLGGSELRLGGGSELFRIGASEVLLRGASERLFAGASQWLLRGASELRLGGASESRVRGASESRLGGASERVHAGASESRLGGASERLHAGASEARLGGASERPAAGAAAPRLDGSYPVLPE